MLSSNHVRVSIHAELVVLPAAVAPGFPAPALSATCVSGSGSACTLGHGSAVLAVDGVAGLAKCTEGRCNSGLATVAASGGGTRSRTVENFGTPELARVPMRDNVCAGQTVVNHGTLSDIESTFSRTAKAQRSAGLERRIARDPACRAGQRGNRPYFTGAAHLLGGPARHRATVGERLRQRRGGIRCSVRCELQERIRAGAPSGVTRFDHRWRANKPK